MSEIDIQQALKAYVSARKQTAYRHLLMEEAERDLKNKIDDCLVSERAEAAALGDLIKSVDSNKLEGQA